MRLRVELPPHVADVVRGLPPDVQRAIKGAFRALSEDADIGEPLERDLEGLWRFRVRRFRVVYEIDRRARIVRVYAVGHRRSVYEELSAELTERRQAKRGPP